MTCVTLQEVDIVDHKLDGYTYVITKPSMGHVEITMEAYEKYRKLWQACETWLDNPYHEPEDVWSMLTDIIKEEENNE